MNLRGSVVTDRTAWLAERMSGVGASEAASALGMSPFESPRVLYMRKRGLIPPVEETEAMREGNHWEGYIAQRYEEQTGEKIFVKQLMVRSPDRPMFATLDGVTEGGKPVEFKYTSGYGKGLGEEGTDELPEHWLIQGHQQMLLTGTFEMDFAVKLPGRPVRVYPVTRDEDLCDAILYGVMEFWRWVERGELPPLDARVDRRIMEALYPGCEGEVRLDAQLGRVVDHWEEIGRFQKDYRDDREICAAKILDAMGNHAIGHLPDGRRVVRKNVSVKERTQVVKGHTYTRLYIKGGG